MIRLGFILILAIAQASFGEDFPISWRKIFVSTSEGNDNNAGTYSAPVRSLAKAKQIAIQNSSSAGFAIFLKGGENFTPAVPMTSPILVSYCNYRYRSAFTWDIDKPLLVSTYGNDRLAVLGPGTLTSSSSQTVVDNNALQTAICVCYPCKQNVTIENLHIKHWELGGIFPFKYLPTSSSNKLTIRNNVFEEIGTKFFQGEKFLEPGESYTIYAADVIQPRTSNNIVITDNIFKNIGNDFDAEHTTPFLMDSFHVFYMGNAHDVTISNNIVINTGGPPVKAKYTASYNILVENNAFLYTSPSEQVNTVQEGFIRSLENASVQVKGNQFYCPFVWPEHENPATAVAVMSSGDSTITWGVNSFYMPYYRETIGSSFTNVRNTLYSGTWSRRYYTDSSFIYLNPLNWTPLPETLQPFSTCSVPDAVGLLDLLFDCRYLGTAAAFDPTGWKIDYILGKNDAGILAFGHSATESASGFLELVPKQTITNNTLISEHFDLGVIPSWQLSFANTAADGFNYSVNDENDSKFTVKGLVPAADQKWTSAYLTQTFNSAGDFFLEFKQDWQQVRVQDMPYLQVYLKSAGAIFATIGYEDKSTTEFGHTRVYTSGNAREILGPQSQTGTASWKITRTNNTLSVKLDDVLLTSLAESRPINEIVIAVQGRNMATPGYAWQWTDDMTLGVDLIKFTKLPIPALTGDTDTDNDVDITDFAFMASHWLMDDCSNYKWCNQTDFDYSDRVDFCDLLILVVNWLE